MGIRTRGCEQSRLHAYEMHRRELGDSLPGIERDLEAIKRNHASTTITSALDKQARPATEKYYRSRVQGAKDAIADLDAKIAASQRKIAEIDADKRREELPSERSYREAVARLDSMRSKRNEARQKIAALEAEAESARALDIEALAESLMTSEGARQ